MHDLPRLVSEAAARVTGSVVETPLLRSPALSRVTGADVHLKLENLQHTGSFKVRGALNKLGSLTDGQRDRGVVAASTGNHGLAVAFALERLGSRGTIYLPTTAAPHKLGRLRELGAEVSLYGTDCEQTERHARAQAAAAGRVFLSPYNDPLVVAGQGTIGVEVVRQLGRVPDALLTSVGGGGLMAGVGGYLRSRSRAVQLVGCWPERSAVLYHSIRAGRIVPARSEPTLSDATAGGVEPDSVTFEPCRQLIDRCRLAGEPAIRAAVRLLLEQHGLVIEGAAAVAVAGLLQRPDCFADRTVVVVLCGRNIGPADLRACLADGAP